MADSKQRFMPHTPQPADEDSADLRSMTKNTAENVTKEEQVLGDKATGGVDNDQDHVPNVEGGLKA
jgi:hypothetical protein